MLKVGQGMSRHQDSRWSLLSGLMLVSGVALVLALPLMAGKRVRVVAGDKVLLIGDSLAQALGPPLGQLVTERGIDFVQDAQQGTRVEQWGDSGRAEASVDTFSPSVVIISLGTNDAAANADWQAKFAARAASLVERLKAKGVRDVLWIIPPLMPFDLGVIAQGIADSGAAVFDSRPIDVPRGPDKIHPTVAGSGSWAAAINAAIS